MGTDAADIGLIKGETGLAEDIRSNTRLPMYKMAQPELSHIPLDLNKRSGVKQTVDNLKLILQANQIIVRYNVIKKYVEIIMPNKRFSRENYEEASRIAITSLCHDYEMPTSHIQDYLTLIADEIQFNPIETWIDSKPWDGKDRFQEWLGTIETTNNQIRDLALQKWAIAAVNTWLSSSGEASHLVPILQGAQGIGKDRWCKAMFPKSMSDYILEGHHIDPSNKDSKTNALRHGITILSEFGATNRRQNQNELKAWLTSNEDKIRLPYHRSERIMPRKTAFISTVNELEFLKDDTGNRRFIGLQIKSIDPDHTIDMQQFWAQAASMLKNSVESPWLNLEEIQHFQAHNIQFEQTNSVEERILTMYDWKATNDRLLTATDICKEIGIINPKRSELDQSAKAARTCLNLGKDQHSKRGS